EVRGDTKLWRGRLPWDTQGALLSGGAASEALRGKVFSPQLIRGIPRSPVEEYLWKKCPQFQSFG
ncbi:hypothetical protein J7J45_00995, partial [Candidatus Aerophobetes bacterium]|nr:hypothetical protein [Candidatus Aerophobetes bacterium]